MHAVEDVSFTIVKERPLSFVGSQGVIVEVSVGRSLIRLVEPLRGCEFRWSEYAIIVTDIREAVAISRWFSRSFCLIKPANDVVRPSSGTVA